MLAENEILGNHARLLFRLRPPSGRGVDRPSRSSLPALQLTVVIENRLQKAAILFRLRVIRNKPAQRS